MSAKARAIVPYHAMGLDCLASLLSFYCASGVVKLIAIASALPLLSRLSFLLAAAAAASVLIQATRNTSNAHHYVPKPLPAPLPVHCHLDLYRCEDAIYNPNIYPITVVVSIFFSIIPI